ncbi:MAG: DUF6272 family protein [Bacteroidota bacterium]
MEKKFKTAFKLAKESMISELDISGEGDLNINGTYRDIEDVVGKVSVNRLVIRKSYFISVELIENAVKYGVLIGNFKNRFFLGYNNSKFYFFSGNLVETKEVDFIQSKLDEINLVFEVDNSKELLRKMYKDKLKEVGLSNESVKVGIIDLARKLENKILYNFKRFDDNYSVFSIICTLDDKEN